MSDEAPDPGVGALPAGMLFYAPHAKSKRGDAPLPRPVRRQLDLPREYHPDPSLVAAVNVALMLRMPLLLLGAPGTGKTELARSVARELHRGEHGLEAPFYYQVTVTSSSDKAEVLYRYDELRRLRDAYDKDRGAQREPDASYVSFVGLGAALIAAGTPQTSVTPIGGRQLAKGVLTYSDLLAPFGRAEGPPGFAFLPPGSRPSVVLIDEIDKAPRELPNDLLTELDRMQFDIPELGARITLSDASRWPIVIITSNNERPLPDAFRRRCICLELEPPLGERLEAIIAAKLKELVSSGELVSDADPGRLAREISELNEALRQSSLPPTEKPATARLLDFSLLLADRQRLNQPSLRQAGEVMMRAALTALVPSAESQKVAMKVWQTWQQQPPTPTA